MGRAASGKGRQVESTATDFLEGAGGSGLYAAAMKRHAGVSLRSGSLLE